MFFHVDKSSPLYIKLMYVAPFIIMFVHFIFNKRINLFDFLFLFNFNFLWITCSLKVLDYLSFHSFKKVIPETQSAH